MKSGWKKTTILTLAAAFLSTSFLAGDALAQVGADHIRSMSPSHALKAIKNAKHKSVRGDKRAHSALSRGKQRAQQGTAGLHVGGRSNTTQVQVASGKNHKRHSDGSIDRHHIGKAGGIVKAITGRVSGKKQDAKQAHMTRMEIHRDDHRL